MQYNGDSTRFIVKQMALGEKVRAGVGKKYNLDPAQIRMLRDDGQPIECRENLKVNGMEAGRTYQVEVVVEQVGGATPLKRCEFPSTLGDDKFHH